MCQVSLSQLNSNVVSGGVGGVVVESTLSHRRPKKSDEIGLKGLSKLIVQNSDLVQKCICIENFGNFRFTDLKCH